MAMISEAQRERRDEVTLYEKELIHVQGTLEVVSDNILDLRNKLIDGDLDHQSTLNTLSRNLFKLREAIHNLQASVHTGAKITASAKVYAAELTAELEDTKVKVDEHNAKLRSR